MTKETDRKLLELAAKAGGIELLDWRDQWADYSGPAWRTTERKLWNPLTDDGDALRMAVKLGLYVNIFGMEIGYCIGGVLYTLHINIEEGDVLASIRRAIVRAAAEIWRAMP